MKTTTRFGLVTAGALALLFVLSGCEKKQRKNIGRARQAT